MKIPILRIERSLVCIFLSESDGVGESSGSARPVSDGSSGFHVQN